MNQGVWISDRDISLENFHSTAIYGWITRYEDGKSIYLGRLDFHHALSVL